MSLPIHITVADLIGYLKTFDPNTPVVESMEDFDDDDIASISSGEVVFVDMTMIYPAMESTLATGEGRTWRE